MKKFILILTAIITIASLLFAGGCEKNKIGTDNKANPDIVDIGTSVTGHFINLYVIPDSISIGNTTYFDTDSTWTLIFKGDDITHQYKDSAMLRKLSESLGDTSYTEPTTPSYARAVAGTVYSVDVVCDRDFLGVKAGKSLGGIVMLRALSAYEFIQSGYTATFDMPYWIDYPKSNLYPIETVGTEIGPDGLKAIEPRCGLHFTEIPEGIGECTFTVTVSVDDRQLQCSVTQSF